MEAIICDKALDDRIRSALKDADSKGKLSVVSAIVGPSVEELKAIMRGTGELSLMDRGMLGMHLGCD